MYAVLAEEALTQALLQHSSTEFPQQFSTLEMKGTALLSLSYNVQSHITLTLYQPMTIFAIIISNEFKEVILGVSRYAEFGFQS